MNKKLLLIIILCGSFICSFAQNWTKEMTKDFRKSEDVALIIDFKDAQIWGLSYDEFIPYYSEQTGKTEKYIEMYFKRVSGKFANNFAKKTKKNIIEPTIGSFNIYFVFENITENGGFSFQYIVEKDGIESAAYRFTQNDGRWNDFERLFEENLEHSINAHRLDFLSVKLERKQ